MRILPDSGLQERLLAHLHEVVRERDPAAAPDGHAHVQAYIGRVLAGFGEVRMQAFAHLGRIHHNLILNLPGNAGRPFILVGAHFDAAPGSPGADDNGSALAVLLELARVFSAAPVRHPLRLVAFDLEERGQAGSRAYANELTARGERPKLMISLEMLGYRDARPGSQRYPAGLRHFYPATADFIALLGNLRTLPMLRRLACTMRKAVPCEFLAVPLCGRVLPDSRRSDHAAFWDAGYPAIMVTDTANMRNPHYHRPGDRIETLDLDFLAAVCRGLAAGLRAL
ncbi:MAG TPA: M28 family peptidase [Beijerinckiaceae bacterium]|jgi:Zn-dependent M28 family amino/carboxypeptidase